MLRRMYGNLATLLVASVLVQCNSLQEISRELPSGIEVIRDITYATYGDRSLLLDLYLPDEKGSDPLPVTVVIRGGDWRRGGKDGFGPMAAAFAKRGLAAACIEYRASGEAIFPAAVEDTKAAVRWLRANGGRYRIARDAIGAIGGSAGAHLATYLGVTSAVAKLEEKGGNPNYSSAISAVAAFATPADLLLVSDVISIQDRLIMYFFGNPLVEFFGSDDRDLLQFASPITHVTEDAPALLLIHSESDNRVPYDQSLRLAARYREVGVPVEVVMIPDAPHAFWSYENWFEESMDKSAAFLWRHLDADKKVPPSVKGQH